MIQIQCYNKNYMQENTYVVIDESTRHGLIIDPGCYPSEMKEALSTLASVDYIILTHAHGDHIAALPSVRQDFPSAKLIAGKLECDFLMNVSLNHSNHFAPEPIETEADRYVEDGEDIKLGETIFQVITTPGHTPGGICIQAEQVLFSGDTLFAGSIGRTDFEGGSWQQMKESLDRLMLLPDDTIVLSGHGGQTTIGQERRSNPFV